MKFELVATCLFGLEHQLGQEIDKLGYERISTINGRVTFLGDEEAVALSNVFLRFAERIFIKLGSFRAETFDELFEGPTCAIACEHREVVDMDIAVFMRFSDLLVINLGEPIVSCDSTGV